MAAAVAGVTPTSRILWAFARDRAAPFSGFLSDVNQKKQVPVRAIWIIVILQIVLGLIYLASSTAFNAILSMAIVSMYTSYIIPIAAMLFGGRGRVRSADYGPFKLGRSLGVILNIVSVGWILVSMVFSTFPGVMPTTADNMNYSIVVIIGWLVFDFLFYLVSGRRKFEMPIVSAGLIMGIPLTVDPAA